MTSISAKVRISGRVQGVWFRQSTREQAAELGVTGWCRNCPDGSVEAVFQGDEKIVNAIIDWCHQGPKLAQVEHVHIEWLDSGGVFNSFEIRA
ncbi:acylphosphatase [Pelovirga terrestris]|uniref:Acylphosphatase n=1 Tax=Pelovirga terrestris TaxID=2771352 RepID=A0A8J6UGP9_9BACT|nr:acylphosphatase [Pelovirga terrestris]MBD1400153.1 acylphosphatase [Pelovirga terrestris]